MSFDPERETALLRKKMTALRAKPHLPAALLDLAEAVYSRQITARSQAVVDVPGPEALAPAERAARGEPLLAREFFPYDVAQAGALCGEFLTLLRQAPGPAAEAARLAGEALDSGSPSFETAAKAYLKGDYALFSAFGENAPAAPGTLSFLVQSSLTPSLAQVSLRLLPRWPEHKTWTHGHCPVCGSPPLIGVLEGKEGRRYLWCSFCGASYRVPRLTCPICLEDDSAKLPFYTSPDEPGFRLTTCAGCNHYLKTVDFREFDRVSLPLLDDLESLSLDVHAGKLGFVRPALSGWGF
ncbi:MAG: formate dehydrogenase accessory protein FdhE [Desulfovibrionaceae bacterium]|nr:formate dehydrogenase accessory protein FdhE [Desulfovibrionaceae bacterium]MBF0514647.1 formate dehydrogenase accessory protein FdhE [Desulfovibrionaceae bacterium]